jgi:hypothetical protein
MLRKAWQPIAVTSFILLLLQEIAACHGVPKGATHAGKNRTMFRSDAIGAVTDLGAFPRHRSPPANLLTRILAGAARPARLTAFWANVLAGLLASPLIP